MDTHASGAPPGAATGIAMCDVAVAGRASSASPTGSLGAGHVVSLHSALACRADKAVDWPSSHRATRIRDVEPNGGRSTRAIG